MEKSIYKLLNEVDTDYEEYEQTELSLEEKEYYKQKILAEVKIMKMEEKRKKRMLFKKAAGLAAACAIVTGAAAMAATPALARQLFSSVFEKIIATSDERILGQKELSEKVGAKAKPAQDELAKQQNPGNYTTSVQCNGITLAVSDVYCNGSVLYYTLSLSTDNADMNKADAFLLYLQDGKMTTPTLQGGNGETIYSGGGTLSTLKKAEDGSYVCMDEIDLFALSEADRKKLQIEESGILNVEYELEGLTGVIDLDQIDDQGNYKEVAAVEGKWNLKFPVTVDTSIPEKIEINKEENGILIKNIIKTDTTLVIEVDYSGYAARYSYDDRIYPSLSVMDSNGEYLPCLGGGSSGDGAPFTVQEQFLYHGQKELVISTTHYIDDSQPIEKIADIPIQLP